MQQKFREKKPTSHSLESEVSTLTHSDDLMSFFSSPYSLVFEVENLHGFQLNILGMVRAFIIKLHTHNTVRQLRDNLIPKLTTEVFTTESGGVKKQSEAFALEATLQTVKGVLESIQKSVGQKGDHGTTQNNANNTSATEGNNGISTAAKKKDKDDSSSMKKTLSYYHWLEEQIEQYKDNVDYTTELNKEIRALTPRIVEFYQKLAESDKEDPAWLAPLIEKHTLRMSKIKGGQSLKEQNAYIKEWVSLSKQLGVLDAKINSGIFDEAILAQATQERQFVLDRIAEITSLIDDPGEGFVDAGMAHFAGQYDTVGQQRSKRLEKLAAQYEELGRLDAHHQAGSVSCIHPIQPSDTCHQQGDPERRGDIASYFYYQSNCAQWYYEITTVHNFIEDSTKAGWRICQLRCPVLRKALRNQRKQV